jgi:di/tricarboxylate transporter
MNFALISLLSVILVFVIGAFRKNPLHLGILALFIAFILGRFAGLTDVKIMALFPTTLFVRVFGIMLFFGIAQANGSLELLAKKLISKGGKNIKLLPFYLFYVGIFLGAIGINSLAGMAILSGIGISLAKASGGNPLLFGIAGGYGVATGCYSPINEYTANITAAAEQAKLPVNLLSIFIFALVAYSISFTVIYFIMGGHKIKGHISGEAIGDLPKFNRNQLITLTGIIFVLILVTIGVDVGWAGLVVAVASILLGCSTSTDAIKKVSLGSLMLISGVGTLINLVSSLKGFELLSATLANVMTSTTVAPIMSITSSIMSLFTISRLVVITLIPTLPGIIAAVPGVSINLAVASTAAGAFASSIGPLSANGALIIQNLGQQFGENEASKYFSKQMLMGVIGGIVIALICLLAGLLGVF